MMNGDSKSRTFSESLVLDDSEEGVVITGITDDIVAAKSGLQAGDEIVAATIHLDHLNKDEVLNILKVLEPYDNNMKVLTKKQLGASSDLGSLGFDLGDQTKMLQRDLSLDASANGPEVSFDGLGGKLNSAQGLGGEIGGPTLNGDLPSLSLDKPSLGLTGPNTKGDLDGTLETPDVNVSAPKIHAPSASFDTDKPEIKTGKLKYKAPKFTMPNFNLPTFKTSKPEMDVSGDADLPSVSGKLETSDLNLSAPKLDLKNPDLDLDGPKVDLNGQDLHLENGDFQEPSGRFKWSPKKWKGPRIKGTNAELNADMSGPDVSFPTPEIEGDLSANPKADIKSPGLEVHTSKPDTGTINWPHLKWKKPHIHGPKADLATPDVDLKDPDIAMQTPDINVDGPSGINWSRFKLKKKPKFQGPKADLDINADVNTPDLNVSTPKIEGDINAPNAELNLPNAEFNGPNVDLQSPNLDIDAPVKPNRPHFKWKKPKIHGSGPDIDLKEDLSTPDVDLSLPKTDWEASTPHLNLPKAGVDVKAPDADVEAPSGKIRMPSLKMPKFGFSGPKVKGPDVDLDADVKVPDPSLSTQASFDGPDLNLPKADIKAPNVDKGFKWHTLKKPKWSASGPKINGLDADVDADVSAPDLSLKAQEIDCDINAPDVNLNLAKTDVDINAPDVDGPSGKFKWFKSKFGTLKGQKGNIEGNVKVPDMDLKTDVSAPNIEGGIGAPDINADIDNLNVDSTDGKLRFPKINLPKLKGPKAKGPELEADFKAPNIDGSVDLPVGNVEPPNVDLSLPTTEVVLDTPDLDLNLPKANLEGPDVDLQAPEVEKFRLPKAKLPKLDLSGLKIKRSDLDVNADKPNLNVSAPSIEGNHSHPDLDLPSPGVTKGDFQVPDLNLKAPDLSLSETNLDTKLPKTELNAPGTLTAPDIDVNLPKPLKTPDLDFDSRLGDPNLPHFKHPKLDLSSPEVEVPNVHPSMEAGIEAPKVNIGTTDAEIKSSPKSKLRWPFKWGFKSGSDSTDEEDIAVDSETDAEVDVPVFKTHRLPRPTIDAIGGIDDTFDSLKVDTEAKDYVVSRGIRLPIVNATSKSGEKIDIFERLKIAREKAPSANVSPTESKTEIDLGLPAQTLDVSAVTESGDFVRGGTFKVEKPESLGLVAPEISTSDENEKLSLSLSNMLGLNVNDSAAD